MSLATMVGRLLERGGILGGLLDSETVSKSELSLGGLGGSWTELELFSLGSLGVRLLEKGSAGSSDSLLRSVFIFPEEFPSGSSLSKVASLPWLVMLGIGATLAASISLNFKVLVFRRAGSSLTEVG